MFCLSAFSIDTHGTITCSFRSFVKNRGEKKTFPQDIFLPLLSTIAIINTQIYNDYSVIEVSTTQTCTIVIRMDIVYGLLVFRMVWKALKDTIVFKRFFF